MIAYAKHLRALVQRTLSRSPAARPATPFIVGAPRSGTTLLRMMIDAHPSIAIPPETGFVPAAAKLQAGTTVELRELLARLVTEAATWVDFGLDAELFRHELTLLPEPFSIAEGVRTFYRLYARSHGKTGFGDKTPGYVFSMPEIEALLPEVAFIHIIRDGRDAALSLRPLWFSPGHGIDQQASHWLRHVRAARDGGRACRKYHEVRFEDLVRDTPTQLRRICEFLDLAYHPMMLRSHERAAARLAEHRERTGPGGRVFLTKTQRIAQQWRTTTPPDAGRIAVWKTSMSLEEQREFARAAGGLLKELGYEV
jgi:hypothetical protein